MKVWVDVSGLYNWGGNFTGIQRVVYNISKELSTSDMEHGFFIYHPSGRFTEISFAMLESHIKSKATEENSSKSKKIQLKKPQYYAITGLKELFRGTGLEPPLRRIYGSIRREYHKLLSLPTSVPHKLPFNKGDKVIVIDGNWHFKGFAESIISAKSKKHVYLIHFVQDLIAYNNPALVNKGANKIIGDYFKKIFKSADQLIAISKSTKKDIEWFLKINNISNRPEISVIRLGDKISEQPNLVSKKPAKEVPEKYILSVSTIEVRKNYLAFYYVYNLAFQKDIDLPGLVIVGRKGWMAEETYSLLTQDPKINKKITILNSRDDELEWLYQHCMFTVFPSFYEGWGLPIAESLAHGKCCISSNASSMPEVGGNLVSYVSPYDPAELLDEIVHLSDKKVRSPIEQKIADEYRVVTWEDTFKQFRDIVTEINE